MNVLGLLLYNIALKIYWLFLYLASFFHPKAKLWITGRKNWKQDLAKLNLTDVVWFHTPSLGEFEQARPLIESIKKNHPKTKIVLSFFSPSGFEIRKDYEKVDAVFYLPLDSKQNANYLLELIKPKLIVWTKYDIWYHFLTQAKEKAVPIVLISAIFRPNQWYFSFYGNFMKNALNAFEHIFVQNEASKQLLAELNIDQVSVKADTRYDSVMTHAKHPQALPLIKEFKNDKPLFVIGSMWESDEFVLLPFINQNKEKIKFVIAPHEVDSKKIEKLRERIEGEVSLYSNKNFNKSAEVLIVDSIGILSSIYQYADFSYIGGGFGVGIHNILEPVVFGNIVFIGPNHEKFKEAKELVEAEAVFKISNYNSLKSVFSKLRDSDVQGTIKTKLKEYIKENAGASDEILRYIQQKNWL